MAELAKSKLDPPKRLAELAQRHWGELDAGTRVWDRPAAEVAALNRLTLADLRVFFEVGFLPGRDDRAVAVSSTCRQCACDAGMRCCCRGSCPW